MQSNQRSQIKHQLVATEINAMQCDTMPHHATRCHMMRCHATGYVGLLLTFVFYVFALIGYAVKSTK